MKINMHYAKKGLVAIISIIKALPRWHTHDGDGRIFAFESINRTTRSQKLICSKPAIERCFKVQNVVLIGLLVDVLNRHFRVEELIEI